MRIQLSSTPIEVAKGRVDFWCAKLWSEYGNGRKFFVSLKENANGFAKVIVDIETNKQRNLRMMSLLSYAN